MTVNHHIDPLLRGHRVRWSIGLCLLFVLHPASAQQAGLDTTSGFDVSPATTTPPGGFQGSALPQFILVTFDDGINSFAESFIQPVVDSLRNPDGSRAPVTYFMTKVNTDSDRARQLYLEGNEIANHTATHTTNGETPYDVWIWELTQVNQFLVNSVGVPSKQIAGFRAPNLSTNNALWAALHHLHFTYDASLSEFPTSPPIVSTGLDSLIWPYTLQDGAKTVCLAEACPDSGIPGLWSIPLWEYFDTSGADLGAMDPAVGYDSVFAESLEYMFTKRYDGNRCPMGIYLHAGQLWSASRQEVLRSFLERKLRLPDVWMITMHGLIEWMRHPVPTAKMSAWLAAGGGRGIGAPDHAPPDSTFRVSPADSTRFTESTVPLLWDVNLDADMYELQIATDSAYVHVVLDTAGLTRTRFQAPLSLGSGSLSWRVRAWNSKGSGPWSSSGSFILNRTTSVMPGSISPDRSRLEQNYPNPFNPSTTIEYTVAGAGGQGLGIREVHIVIYDLLGRNVATLVNGRQSPGTYAVRFDGSNLPSGVYFCRMTAGAFTQVQPMILAK